MLNVHNNNNTYRTPPQRRHRRRTNNRSTLTSSNMKRLQRQAGQIKNINYNIGGNYYVYDKLCYKYLIEFEIIIEDNTTI